MTASTLNAFWSYSRVGEGIGGSELHTTMQAALADPISPWGELRIFRDIARHNSITPGADWPRAITAAIARSTLFFWVQSPMWLKSWVCVFEFDAFEDRVARIAAEFIPSGSSVTAQTLSEALLKPVRMFEMEEEWVRIDIDPGLRNRFESEWSRRHVMPELRFSLAHGHPSHESSPYSYRCTRAAQPIARSFGRTLDALGGVSLARLNEFLTDDSQDFERRWMGIFEERFSELRRPDGPGTRDDDWTAQQRLMKRLTRPPNKIGLSFVLVPDVQGKQGFWVAAKPLPNKFQSNVTERISSQYPVALGSGGFLQFSAEAVKRFHRYLRTIGLDLPDAEQASRIQAVFAKRSDHALRLGFESNLSSGFWHINADGVSTRSTDGQAWAALLPVATVH